MYLYIFVCISTGIFLEQLWSEKSSDGKVGEKIAPPLAPRDLHFVQTRWHHKSLSLNKNEKWARKKMFNFAEKAFLKQL